MRARQRRTRGRVSRMRKKSFLLAGGGQRERESQRAITNPIVKTGYTRFSLVTYHLFLGGYPFQHTTNIAEASAHQRCIIYTHFFHCILYTTPPAVSGATTTLNKFHLTSYIYIYIWDDLLLFFSSTQEM